MHRLGRIVARARIVGFLALAALAAAAGWGLRYAVVEPEALGEACRIGGPWWCPLRTALIVATEWGGLGIAGALAAVAAIFVRGRAAYFLIAVAMVLGGAGLYLYNTTFAAAAVLIALLRAARCDGDTEQAP